MTDNRDVVKECAKHAREEDVDAKVRKIFPVVEDSFNSSAFSFHAHEDCADAHTYIKSISFRYKVYSTDTDW